MFLRIFFFFFNTWKSLILSGNSLFFSDSMVASSVCVIARVFTSATHKWEVCSLKNSWRTCVSALVGLASSMLCGKVELREGLVWDWSWSSAASSLLDKGLVGNTVDPSCEL